MLNIFLARFAISISVSIYSAIPLCWILHTPLCSEFPSMLFLCWSGDKNSIWPVENLCHLYERFSSGTTGGGQPRVNWLEQPLKRKWWWWWSTTKLRKLTHRTAFLARTRSISRPIILQFRYRSIFSFFFQSCSSASTDTAVTVTLSNSFHFEKKYFRMSLLQWCTDVFRS